MRTTALSLCPRILLFITCFFIVMGLSHAAPTRVSDTEARRIHESLLTLDTHLDTPAHFAWRDWDIMDRHRVDQDGSQVDYPRMVDGGLDGGFFAIYTPQGPRTPEALRAARDAGLLRAVEIREMLARHGDKFALALRADDAAAIASKGMRVVFMSIENAYPLGADLSLMTTFYTLGVRLLSPVHFSNNDFGDSSTDPKGAEWHGLSPLGKALVAEANRLGIVLDASHASDDVLDQMMALSKTPILLSHSGCKAVFNHPRNVDDERLRALAAQGGVIQVDAYSDYLISTPKNADREKELASLFKTYREHSNPSKELRESMHARLKSINAHYAVPRATFDDFIQHLLHAIKIVGLDHVGIGIDFDGGGGVVGLEDASDYPRITARLLQEGYSQADLAKIWSGNVLRVLRAVESAKEEAR